MRFNTTSTSSSCNYTTSSKSSKRLLNIEWWCTLIVIIGILIHIVFVVVPTPLLQVVVPFTLVVKAVETNFSTHDLCTNALPVLNIGSSRNRTRYNTSGIWFNLIGTGDVIVVEATFVTPPVLFDFPTPIFVYEGGCNSATRQLVVKTEKLNGFIPIDYVVFETTIGTEYHISVGSPTNAVDVAIYVAPPSNDLCKNAQQVAITSSNVSMKFETTFATKDIDVKDNCIDGKPPDKRGIWFNFTGTGGDILVRAGNDYRYSIISMYTGGCDSSARRCVAATNSSCAKKELIFNTVVDVTYHALVQICGGPTAPFPVSSEIEVSIFDVGRIPQLNSCGLFGFNIFCPQPNKCGLLRRLFGINGC